MASWAHTDARFAPVDREQIAVVDAQNKLSGPVPDPLEPIKLREALLLKARPGSEPVAAVVEKRIPGPNGDVPIRVFQPMREVDARGDLSVLVYFHGGCWFLNNLDTHDAFMRRLANAGQFIVLGVDYRRAPENPFPAALEDCYAAVKWASEEAGQIGGDPRRLAVGGDSCGGNLAAAVSLLCKEREGPALKMQLLLYPMTDHPGREAEHTTLRTMATLPSYPREINDLGWDIYGAAAAPHGTPEAPDYHAAVLRAPDLTGLPPAHVALAQCDIVYDEGLHYAERLKAAGNAVSVRHYEGCVHGFMAYSALAPDFGLEIKAGPPAIQETVDILNRAFSQA